MIENYSMVFEKIEAQIPITDDISVQKMAKIFSFSLLFTGIFAAVGALYRWGAGSLFDLSLGNDIQLFIAELIVAAPASIIASFGIRKMKKWGMILGLLSTGVYIYGSVLVYAELFLSGPPFPLKLLIPPIFGLLLSISILFWIQKNFDNFK